MPVRPYHRRNVFVINPEGTHQQRSWSPDTAESISSSDMNPRVNSDVVSIYLFPGEIIYEIFRHLSTETLIECCRVCRRWRYVALDHPSLWTRITTTCLYDIQGPMILERARGRLLSLEFRRKLYIPSNRQFLSLDDERLSNILSDEQLSNILNRTSSITNITTIDIPRLPLSMPELVTIKFRDLVDLHSTTFLQGSPKLLHLSAEISFLPAIDSMPFSAHLQTLHLSNKLPPPDQVLTALSNLPSLKELLLHDTHFPKRPGTSEQSDIPYPDNLRLKEIRETHGLPTLDLIWIRGYNAHDLSQILIPPFIDLGTNVRVEMVPDRENPLKFNCKKKDIPSSLWVRSWQNGFLLDHDTASTEVIFHSKTDTKIDTEETSFFMIPSFVSPSFIVSLSFDGRGDPPPIALLQKFPNLTRLHFLFVLSLESAALRSISTTLNGNLARSCPQLEFIGLTLKKAHQKTQIPYCDGAEYAVKDFLKSWLEIHGAIFGTVRLQDEIKPARWERHMSTLKNLVRSFELGYMRSQPSFPRARKFDEGFD